MENKFGITEDLYMLHRTDIKRLFKSLLFAKKNGHIEMHFTDPITATKTLSALERIWK